MRNCYAEEEALMHASNEETIYLQHVLDEVPVMVWVSDTSKLCTMFNRQWLDFTGRTIEQEFGTGWVDGVHPDDIVRCVQTYEEAFDARLAFQMEYRLRHHSGAYRWVSDHGQPRHSDTGEFIGYFGTCVDLTDQKNVESENSRLRDELEQARRTESLGRVAATLAHEFNNVLMAILPFAELLLRPELPASKRDAAAHHIRDAVKRGKHVTAEVLRYTRPAELKLEPVDISAWLPGALERLRALAGSVKLHSDIPPDLTPVLADRDQLEQALSNLVTNARDAVPNVADGTITVSVVAGADRVELEVRDNGIGIAPDVLPRICEPLFTTKSKGTGLGLSVVRSIANRHGHDIRIFSEPGAGTRIVMTLSHCPSPQHEVVPQAGPVGVGA